MGARSPRSNNLELEVNPDRAVFHLINNLVGVFPPLDMLARLFVNDYAVPTLFALVLGGLWFVGTNESSRERHQRAVIYGVVGLVLANIIIKIGWSLYFRPRPFAVEDGVRLLFYRPSVSSFPSEPVATLTALTTGVWLFNRTVGWLMVAFTCAFAFSRIMAGVHYPSDIIAGVALAIVCTYLPYRYVPGIGKIIGWVIVRLRGLNLA